MTGKTQLDCGAGVLAAAGVANSIPGAVQPLFVVDSLSQIMMALILVVSLFVSLMSYSYFAQSGEWLEEYYLLLVLASGHRW